MLNLLLLRHSRRYRQLVGLVVVVVVRLWCRLLCKLRWLMVLVRLVLVHVLVVRVMVVGLLLHFHIVLLLLFLLLLLPLGS